MVQLNKHLVVLDPPSCRQHHSFPPPTTYQSRCYDWTEGNSPHPQLRHTPMSKFLGSSRTLQFPTRSEHSLSPPHQILIDKCAWNGTPIHVMSVKEKRVRVLSAATRRVEVDKTAFSHGGLF